MPAGLYMDVHVPRAITTGLRRRGIDVLTAQEDNSATLADPLLLDRATALARPIYTQDDDLLAEAHRRQLAGEHFAGVIYSHQLHSPVGRCIDSLEIIARASDPEDLAGQVEFIPY